MVGIEHGVVRRKIRWVVRFATSAHVVVEMRRDELLSFFFGRLPVAESMKGSTLAFLCRPSAVSEESAAAAALGDLPPDAVVLAGTEPVFKAFVVLSPEQGKSLAQWLQTDPTATE